MWQKYIGYRCSCNHNVDLSNPGQCQSQYKSQVQDGQMAVWAKNKKNPFFSDASQPVSQWPRVVKAAQNTSSCKTWWAIFYMVMYFAKSWIVLVIVVHPIISRTLLFQTLFNCTKIPRYFPHFCHHLGWFPKNNGGFSNLKKSPFVIICHWNFFNICLTLPSIWLL